jgi:ubiquinone/menaquinone biosynthesis C-methylase UbiE
MDSPQLKYQQERISHWDAVARRMDAWKGLGGYYHRRMIQIYQFLVPPAQRVIEMGCAQGDLLAALRPAVGVGVDFSSEMIRRAGRRHPELRFIQIDAHDLNLKGEYDVIILSDLIHDLWDVQAVFQVVKRLAGPRTRVIINSYSRLWELPLAVAKQLGLAAPALYQNWLTVKDIINLLDLADFEHVRHWEEILLPLKIPLLSTLANRYLVKFWPFKFAAMTNFVVARPKRRPESAGKNPRVSVIVPARNEAGNVADIFSRTPEMGQGTELIFVEGYSDDDTYAVIEEAIVKNPQRSCKLLRQTGKGKGDAVRMGFECASGDVLMILDADLTVPPEHLPRFYEVLISGKGEFVNGVRLVYPMEQQAMRFLNLVANKSFSLAFSWLLGQPIKDTLCGTKVLWKEDYESIVSNRAYFGNFDPFGDFDLLFGAAKLNMKIMDLPIRYRQRVYGTTNIRRWSNGWLLLRMVIFAARRIKFI